MSEQIETSRGLFRIEQVSNRKYDDGRPIWRHAGEWLVEEAFYQSMAAHGPIKTKNQRPRWKHFGYYPSRHDAMEAIGVTP